MQQQLLRLPDVLTRVGWGRSTLYMKVNNGEFPPPIALGPRARAWISSEVDGWIQQKIKQGRGDAKRAASQ
jgi:prophage regulatory protein